MKHIIILIVGMGVAACADKKQAALDVFPGTYVKSGENAYGKAAVTMEIQLIEPAHHSYSVVQTRTLLRREKGKTQNGQTERTNYTVNYDEQSDAFIDIARNKRLTINAAGDSLRVNEAVYARVTK